MMLCLSMAIGGRKASDSTQSVRSGGSGSGGGSGGGYGGGGGDAFGGQPGGMNNNQRGVGGGGGGGYPQLPRKYTYCLSNDLFQKAVVEIFLAESYLIELYRFSMNPPASTMSICLSTYALFLKQFGFPISGLFGFWLEIVRV